MTRFLARLGEIEAVQFTGDNLTEIVETLGVDIDQPIDPDESVAELVLETPVGDMTAWVGDWVIKTVAGELVPCNDRVFHATYQPAGT